MLFRSPPLIALVEGGTDGQKERAAVALASLALEDGNRVAIAQAGGVPWLMALAALASAILVAFLMS